MKKIVAILAVMITITIIVWSVLQMEEPEPPSRTYVAKSSPDFTMGLHIAAWTLFEYDWSGTIEDSDWNVNVVQNIDWISKTGYNTILLDVMEPWHGTYFFTCDVLKENGYNEYTDIMGLVVQEAHNHNITVFADHTVLAWRLDEHQTRKYEIKGNKLTVEQVQKVTATLLDEYDFDGIVEESYPLEYVEGIAHIVHERPGKLYIHKFDDPWNNADIFMSEDYVGFLSSPSHVKNVSQTGAAANSIGVFNALFSHAKAVGKPGWVKVTTDRYDLPEGASHNTMLLRAVQFNSDGYFWMPSEENGRELLRNNDPIMDVNTLGTYLTRVRTPLEEKPVANFVILLPFKKEEEYREASYLFLVHAFGPVSNGVMLSGYDIKTTYDEVLPDADMYVVFAIGTVEDVTVELPSELLDVLEQDTPVVFVVWGISNAGNWERTFPYFGISDNWDYAVTTGSIDDVPYKEYTIPWSPPTIWDYPIHTSIIDSDDVSGTVLLSGKKNGKDIALVIQNRNKYLINANALHLQTSFIFTSLFSESFSEPFYGYGVVGERSAFLALKDTPLVVDLPFEEGEEIRITKFNSDGRLSLDERTVYTAPLRMMLNQYELLIVEPGNAVRESSAHYIFGRYTIWMCVMALICYVGCSNYQWLFHLNSVTNKG